MLNVMIGCVGWVHRLARRRNEHRLQGHIACLLTETANKHETGRLQALEMLQQVRAVVEVLGVSQPVSLPMLSVLSAPC
jgi:hypothetical protein